MPARVECNAEGIERTKPAGLLVDVPPMRDSRNHHGFRCIIDEVNYAPVTYPNTPMVPVNFQLLTAGRTRIVGQRQNLAINSPEHGIVQRV